MKYTPLMVGLMASIILTGCGASPKQTVYSGTIEGTEIPIQSELAGPMQKMLAEEGAVVKAAEPLAKLDDRAYVLQVDAAKAAVDSAQAKFEDIKAGARSEDIRQALSQVEIAQAASEAALNQTNAADDQIQMLKANKNALISKLDGAQKTLQYQKERLQRTIALHDQNAVSQQDVDTLQETVNQAQTVVDNLTAQAQALDAQIAQAKNEQQVSIENGKSAAANVQAANAKLDLLKAGSTDNQLRNLLAIVEQANSQLELAELNESKTTIVAPEDGVIVRKDVENGEIIKPGATIYSLLETGHLKVVIYIPEAQLNQVKLGEQANVMVDAYPGQNFQGKVTQIASEAEFTPKNVQTPDERTKMVFAVTLQMTNGFDKLKPGMPADVQFASTEAGANK